MPLEPGIFSHIAAMASRFGQKQCNKDKPNQTTQTPQQQAPKPPTHPINVSRDVFFFGKQLGGDRRGAEGGSNLRVVQRLLDGQVWTRPGLETPGRRNESESV